jgi:PAS domain S-box/diguanylate cyclase (GGDEF) domain
MTTIRLERRWQKFAVMIIVAALYGGAGHLGVLTAIPPGHATAIWPASGIALAAVIVFGRWVWPAIWVGSFAVNILISSTHGFTTSALLAATLIATGATAGALVARALLERSDLRFLLSRVDPTVRFMLLGAVGSSIVSATIGTSTVLLLEALHGGRTVETWLTWWLGDTAGILIMTPLILSWLDPATRLPRRLRLESFAVVALLAVLTIVVFTDTRYHLGYLPIPILIFTAFRYRRRGSTVALFIVSTVSVVATVHGLGPFSLSYLSLNESLLMLQSFLAVVAATTLSLDAVISERESKAEVLEQEKRRSHEAELRAIAAEHAAEVERSRLREAALGKQLMEEELRTAYVIQSSSDLIWRVSPEWMCKYVSPACRSVLGYEPEELVGRSLYDVMHPEEQEEIRSLHSILINGSATSVVSHRLRRKDNQFVWFETSSRAIRHPHSSSTSEIIATSRDITDRKRAEDQVEYQAYHDWMTGLPNRVLFEDRCAVALAQARRFDRKMALLFLDLDRFKNVNDSYGHAVGDQLLQEAAWRMKTCLREVDTLARLGGDEFTLMVPDLGDAEDAAVVAAKLHERLTQPFLIDNHEFFVGVSIGIAIYPHDGIDVESLLRSADGAMYRVKQTGGNGYQFHVPELNTMAAERLSLESALRHAIERREFRVYYHAQFDVYGEKLYAVEALVRWMHPERGIVPPDDFIVVAEDSGLITEIGEFVLRDACRQVKSWQDSDFPGLNLAVNVSARQFRDRDFMSRIDGILQETGFDPKFLELEITEGTAMQSAESTIEILEALRSRGIRVAIDDFGTGYSSLSYLKRFPIDCLKIDKSFLETSESGTDRAIVSSVIQMTHALNLRVVAEGVETQAQREFLEGEDCDLIQGFLYGKPMPADEFVKRPWLDTVA